MLPILVRKYSGTSSLVTARLFRGVDGQNETEDVLSRAGVKMESNI